jgi:hypothetical protein
MIGIKKEGIILTKTDLEFENEGVLDPAAIREGDSGRILKRTGSRSVGIRSIGFC